jgi:hypothetical protein
MVDKLKIIENVNKYFLKYVDKPKFNINNFLKLAKLN